MTKKSVKTDRKARKVVEENAPPLITIDVNCQLLTKTPQLALVTVVVFNVVKCERYNAK